MAALRTKFECPMCHWKGVVTLSEQDQVKILKQGRATKECQNCWAQVDVTKVDPVAVPPKADSD
jgi:transcription elongation factor Elf1